MSRTARRGPGKPKGSYTQARRLIELYDRVCRGETLRAERLAEELGVARRTIERDVAILEEMFGPDRAFRDEGAFRLTTASAKWTTTRWQVLAVAVGARMTGFLSGARFRTHVAPLIAQLRRSLPGVSGYRVEQLERKIHVVETGHKLYREKPEMQRRLEQLLDGLLLERPIELEYWSSKSRQKGLPPRPMRVHALALVLHRASVYFIVDTLSSDRPAPKRVLLSLDRITRAELQRDEEPLEHPKNFDARAFLRTAFAIYTGEAEHDVRILIDRGYAHFVAERTWHETQDLEELPTGEILVRMRLGELEEVTEWVVSMSPHAKVLGPPELEAKVRDRLAKALALYD